MSPAACNALHFYVTVVCVNSIDGPSQNSLNSVMDRCSVLWNTETRKKLWNEIRTFYFFYRLLSAGTGKRILRITWRAIPVRIFC